jgi:aminomethyltransferase
MQMTGLKRTPLYPIYETHGGKTIDFGGWDLPVQFSSIQKEHHAVREAAGLFDVSHMGEVRVVGQDALTYLQQLTVNDAAKLAIGQAQYSLMCYPDGGVVDDLLVYKITETDFMLVLNAANLEKDLDWLRKHVEGDVEIHDISNETALLALQGPLAEQILQKITDKPLAELNNFHFFSDAHIGDVGLIVSRTGYTGEDGFELYVNESHAIEIWERLLEAGETEGLVPVGLGARDTLRFEARLPLYGQELSARITPIEAGLGFFVKLDKGEFIGSEALADQKRYGALRKLVGLEMIDRGIPRSHYPVFIGDEKIGEVTTGTQSPTLKRNVGLALLDKQYAELGTEVLVEIRGKKLRAVTVETPFYKRKKK